MFVSLVQRSRVLYASNHFAGIILFFLMDMIMTLGSCSCFLLILWNRLIHGLTATKNGCRLWWRDEGYLWVQVRMCCAVLQIQVKRAHVLQSLMRMLGWKKKKRELIKLIKTKHSFIASQDHSSLEDSAYVCSVGVPQQPGLIEYGCLWWAFITRKCNCLKCFPPFTSPQHLRIPRLIVVVVISLIEHCHKHLGCTFTLNLL